jgi:RNA polymerase sigma-70 factor (ECF subfamily)
MDTDVVLGNPLGEKKYWSRNRYRLFRFISNMSESQASQSGSIDPSSFLGERGSELLGRVFEEYRPRLEKIVFFRLDPSFRSRLDPADVVQESYFEIARRIHEYSATQGIPLFIWVRQRVLQTMIDMQRSHSREKRSVHRESRLPEPNYNQSTSLSIARMLMDDLPSPSQAAMLVEEQEQLQSALESMHEIDREILAMRHFEQLTNSEVAEVLGLSPTAASNRYVRAAARLTEILKLLPSHRGRA